VTALGLTLLLVAVAAYNGWRRSKGEKAVYNATWPFARLDVEPGQVTISLSRTLAFVTRVLGFDLGEPRRLRPDEVHEVETDFGRSQALFSGGGGLRFRTLDPADERDGTVFWMVPGDRETIIQQVSAAGFRVAVF
jgi:hypothetical protein